MVNPIPTSPFIQLMIFACLFTTQVVQDLVSHTHSTIQINEKGILETVPQFDLLRTRQHAFFMGGNILCLQGPYCYVKASKNLGDILGL